MRTSSATRRWLAACAAFGVAAALGPAAAGAQPRGEEPALSDDVPLPPRLDGSADAPPPPVRPGASRLAALPEDRAEDVEEIVVLGEDNPWRLPDLGSAFRRQQEEERRQGRIEVEFFPLYDPEASRPATGMLTINPEAERVGYIRIFNIRFGRRRR